MTTIDWFRPLRTTCEHHWPVRVDGIQPERGEFCIRLDIHGGGMPWCNRDGVIEGCKTPSVENEPPEIRTIERFGYAYPCGPSTYAVYAHQLLTSREAADEERRQVKGPTYLARILIEVER